MRKDNQLNFSSLAIGDSFKFKPSSNEEVFIKVSRRTAKNNCGIEFKCGSNSLVEKA